MIIHRGFCPMADWIMALNLHNVMVDSPPGREKIVTFTLSAENSLPSSTCFSFLSFSLCFFFLHAESTHLRQKSLSQLDRAYRVSASGLARFSLRAWRSLWSHGTARIPLQRNNGKENLDE